MSQDDNFTIDRRLPLKDQNFDLYSCGQVGLRQYFDSRSYNYHFLTGNFTRFNQKERRPSLKACSAVTIKAEEVCTPRVKEEEKSQEPIRPLKKGNKYSNHNKDVICKKKLLLNKDIIPLDPTDLYKMQSANLIRDLTQARYDQLTGGCKIFATDNTRMKRDLLLKRSAHQSGLESATGPQVGHLLPVRRHLRSVRYGERYRSPR